MVFSLYLNLRVYLALQLGMVFDILLRSGNVHDSNGAREFILACIENVRKACPGIVIEVRMDSAFFSDEIVSALQRGGIESTISVPFERFAELKYLIGGKRRWRRFDAMVSYFDTPWKPKRWDSRFRFLFIRQKVKQQSKEPVQLDLFVPHEYGYEFKVIVTNKTTAVKKVLYFHISIMDAVPRKTRSGNWNSSATWIMWLSGGCTATRCI